MQKREAKFQVTFGHWWKECWKVTGLYELKQTQTDSLSFSSVVEHQIDALYNAKHRELFFKLPDMGFRNPADCFGLSKIAAFIVIKYPSFFCLIDIDVWVEESKSSPRRSLTSTRAKELSTVVVAL